jgi:two-component sensor histidine kinase
MAANARREGYRTEYRMRRADGAWRWVIKTAEPRFAEDGSYLGFAGSLLDITERKEAEEHQALLLREMNHRARNALAVVQAALQLTRTDDVRSYAEAIKGRTAALARAHTLLAAGNWSGADLRALIQAELAAFLNAEAGGGPHVELDGPPGVILTPHAAQGMSMVVHELATNAVKHGALSVSDGHVSVSWKLDRTAGVLWLRWAESGGPPVVGEPARRGFGSRVIETTARQQLGGTLARSWTPKGLICDIAVPLSRAVVGYGAGHATE